MKLCDRYILMEMLWPFVGGLLAFVVMITGHMLFQAVEVMVEHRVPLVDVLRYLSYQLPISAALALPVATLLSVGLSTNRLANDHELLAMRASGVGRIRMLMPGIYLGLIASLLSLGLYHKLVPWAEGRGDVLIRQIAFSQRALAVRPQKFVDAGHGVTFFVEDVDEHSDTLHGIRVFYDQPSGFPLLFSARQASLLQGQLAIRRGTFYSLTPEDDLTSGEVSSTTINLAEVASVAIRESHKLQAMTLSDLRAEAGKLAEQGSNGYRQYSVEFNWRLALAASCLVFAVLAGLLAGSLGQSQNLVGLLVTLLTIFVYYVIMLWLRMLAESGTLPTYGVWTLNGLIILVSLVFLWRRR